MTPNSSDTHAPRQPIHVVYGGAHLFKRTTCSRLGELALRAFNEHASTPAVLSKAMGVPKALASIVHQRVRDKLGREPVEDYRIDFEDGYGIRSDSEEDAAAEAAAVETAEAMAAGTLPPFFGIRIKPLTPQIKVRGTRTLERYLHALTARTGGKLPESFYVTLPKITRPKQVRTLVDALELFPGTQIELMIETTDALLRVNELLDAAKGRCAAAHFGPYDYTASLGITAAHQSLRHPACDFARSTLQVALAGTGIRLSDGPTTTLPVAPHRGETLNKAQSAENRGVVHGAWKLHYDNIRHALAGGFYQGWDLHPAQLPVRYAAVFTFFLESADISSARLRNFIAQSTLATRVGAIFDDAATAQGLLTHFQRALHCGAIPPDQIETLTGLTLEELNSGSFVQIMEGRKKAPAEKAVP